LLPCALTSVTRCMPGRAIDAPTKARPGARLEARSTRQQKRDQVHAGSAIDAPTKARSPKLAALPTTPASHQGREGRSSSPSAARSGAAAPGRLTAAGKAPLGHQARRRTRARALPVERAARIRASCEVDDPRSGLANFTCPACTARHLIQSENHAPLYDRTFIGVIYVASVGYRSVIGLLPVRPDRLDDQYRRPRGFLQPSAATAALSDGKRPRPCKFMLA
jgi:hypothetical protein